ncbi:hypothetical protein BU16DRAFT_95154 [Lophium mytilinum]|uniref:Chitin-binding type-4 domain-containing protein n=1 Tax=Lophium mytilinum TaxID=390894 RepID=A0A6A6QKW3_9PEZI|nr:hypothetical protein BU16DRAFT_95154 [Lophium mytilinum]
MRSFLLTLLPSLISAHGIITTPAPRAVGPALISACGTGVAALITADNTSHVEGLPEAYASSPPAPSYNHSAPACNLWLCKGLQFADNTANVQKYVAGDVVSVKIWLRIPHAGTANVSVVDTRTNEVIGEELKYWDDYAVGPLSGDVPVDQTEFSVTIPGGLEERCGRAGDCVSIPTSVYSTESASVLAHGGLGLDRIGVLMIPSQVLQWWWYGTSAKQTYESCVDFTVAKSVRRNRFWKV